MRVRCNMSFNGYRRFEVLEVDPRLWRPLIEAGVVCPVDRDGNRILGEPAAAIAAALDDTEPLELDAADVTWTTVDTGLAAAVQVDGEWIPLEGEPDP